MIVVAEKNLCSIRKAFLESQRYGLPPPKLSDLRGERRELPAEQQELFIDVLAEILADEFRKGEVTKT